MRSIIILCGLLALTGCQTASQQISINTQAPQLSASEKNCVDAGLKPNTVPFNECVSKSAEAAKKPTVESRKVAQEAVVEDLFDGS